MKVAVCVKQAVDETDLRVDSSGAPMVSAASTKVSVFDKNAVEEALRLKAKAGGEVVVFCLGPPEARKTIKEVLAMGADRAVHVVGDAGSVDSMSTSYLLAKAIRRWGPFDAVLCAEGSSDTYSGQVPPMLSEWLSLPFLGYAKRVEIGASTVTAELSLEDRVETVEAPIPFLASVVSEINEPRYPTLIQIMQASKKQVEEVPAVDLAGGELPRATSVTSLTALSMDRKRIIFSGPPEETAKKLLDALRGEGVIQK